MKRFLMCLLCCGMFLCVNGCSEEKSLEWPKSGLSSVLPVPESSKGEVSNDSDDLFRAKISEVEKDDFKDYVNACKEKGFIIESEETSYLFNSFNDKGYELRITFYENHDEYEIMLYAPKEIGNFDWPNTGMAKLIPSPKSTSGKIKSDSSDSLSLYVNNTSIEDFKKYVNECKKAGFDVDYDSYEKSYSANDKNGNELSIKYSGFNIMDIYIHKGDNTINTSNEDSNVTDNSSETSKETINESDKKPVKEETSDTSFRSAMESYEKFFDEYVSFMKKYQNSDDATDLLSDYSNYIRQYSDTMNKMNSIDTSKLSIDDMVYYTEVNDRIMKKLATIQE